MKSNIQKFKAKVKKVLNEGAVGAIKFVCTANDLNEANQIKMALNQLGYDTPAIMRKFKCVCTGWFDGDLPIVFVMLRNGGIVEANHYPTLDNMDYPKLTFK